jgi:hypothetical protein
MPGNPIGQFGDVTVITDAATQSWDCSGGGQFQWTLGASRTMSEPTGMVPGQLIEIRVVQDGTGSRLVTWPATFAWPAATAPTLTTGANKMDIVRGTWDGLNSKWRMAAASLNYTV